MSHADPLSHYRISADRPLNEELARIAGAELAVARTQLGEMAADPARAVHQCRKSLKRLRALARLARSRNRRDYYLVDAHLRAAGRTLSRARDADVLATIAKTYLSEADATLTIGQIAARLQPDAADTIAAQCRAALDAAEPLLDALFPHSDTVRHTALAEDVAHVYGSAKKALDRFRETETEEDAHRFRRSLQRHVAQQKLIAPLTQADLVCRIGALDELAGLLGDHHDLALLRDLLDCSASALDDRLRQARLAQATTNQAELGRRILDAAHGLFDAMPERFAADLFSPPADSGVIATAANGI